MCKNKILTVTVLSSALVLLHPSYSFSGKSIEDNGTNRRETIRKGWWGKIIQSINANTSLGDQSYGPGDHEFTVMHQGLRRRYIVHVPLSYTNSSLMPVVIAFHGGGGNAEGSVKFFNLTQKADQKNFIIVYPEGTGQEVNGKIFGSWNAGRCCNPASRNKIDDVGFISKMIDELEENFNIDKNRVFAIGHSNGALISFRLACEIPNKIAALAVAGAHDAYDGVCKPDRAVPIFYMHGTDDQCAPYEGGTCGGCMVEYLSKSYNLKQKANSTWECRSVEEYIDDWKKINGCLGESKITYRNRTASCKSFLGCKDRSEVTLCTVEGMGHAWPGKMEYGIEACRTYPDSRFCRNWIETVGELSGDLNANDALWEFFKKHSLQEEAENL